MRVLEGSAENCSSGCHHRTNSHESNIKQYGNTRLTAVVETDQFLTRAAARDKELPSWSAQIGRFPPLPLPHDGIADSRHIMAISPLIQRASRGETRSTLGQRKATPKTWIPCQNLIAAQRRLPSPSPASGSRLPTGSPENSDRIFRQPGGDASGNCWSTLLALGQHTPCFQSQSELESSSLRLPLTQSP